jgi:hypothetical protein
MTQLLKPGTPAPRSGQYEVVGPRGGRMRREVTSTKNHPLPRLRSLAKGMFWWIRLDTKVVLSELTRGGGSRLSQQVTTLRSLHGETFR